jgi:hypothetical protein
MYRSAPSVIAEVTPIRTTAAATSFMRDMGSLAGTDCLTCSAGAAVGVSAPGCFELSQNPVVALATAGLAGRGAAGVLAAGAPDACTADGGELDGGEA